MIEAINSSVAASSILRPVVEQVSNPRAQSSSIEPVQRLAQAPYVSPYLFVDNANNKIILQIRDSESGDVVRQIPSDSQIRAYAQNIQRPILKESSTGRADQTNTASDTDSGDVVSSSAESLGGSAGARPSSAVAAPLIDAGVDVQVESSEPAPVSVQITA